MEVGNADYSGTEVPAGYACGECGATGVKLWRDYQTLLDGQTLLCAPCACDEQDKWDDVDEQGLRSSEYGKSRTDQIGWRVPAVPCEEGNTFWGYTSVPPDGVAWWKRLPTRPATPAPQTADRR